MKRLLLIVALLLGAFAADAQSEATFKRTEDVVYGRKFGMALTMDVFQPEKTNNGYGVIWIVSAGWFSEHEMIPRSFPTLVDRGYTVFAVVHGSQPKFHIPDCMEDVHRAVRFVRHNAARWNIDPERLGVMGGSAGGHLSLVLATEGGPGDAKAKDAIDRESSAVQAVACFFPPTDFLNYGKMDQTELGDRVLKFVKKAFPEPNNEADRQRIAREISPIYFVHSNEPPILILHGDADMIVPVQQSESFVTRCQEVGATAKLVVEPGKGHGWPGFMNDLSMFADWFDEQLRGIKQRPGVSVGR
jgi:acetyl esterase/lipase